MKASENPFRSSSVERIRYELDATELRALADRAISLKQSCLLGPHGTGKTTLLEDIGDALHERGFVTHYIRLNTSSTREEQGAAMLTLDGLPKACFCLFDGAEVLNLRQRFQLRHARRTQGFGLIATMHRKTLLPTLYQTTTDWNVAERCVRVLAGDGCDSALIDQARIAFDQNDGNIREVFRACYFEMARRA